MSDEAQAILRARQGDAAAWEALVQTYQQPVFRLAYLLTGDPDEAEDIAQETFLRALRSLGRFDLERPLRPWLLRITSRLASNGRRSAGRYLAALQRLVRAQPPEPSARQQAEQRLDSELLWEAVRRLNSSDQRILYLRYFLECSEAETARVLEIPAGTVKSRLHRSLARLRQVLRDDYPQLIPEGNDVL